jgi:hypothetical protein
MLPVLYFRQPSAVLLVKQHPWARVQDGGQKMVTIPVQLSNELASRVLPLQERLPEIIELGLRHLTGGSAAGDSVRAREQLIETLSATGIITLPTPRRRRQTSRQPVLAGGPSASDMILAERQSRQ